MKLFETLNCVSHRNSTFSTFIAKPTKEFALCQAQPNHCFCVAHFLYKMLLGGFYCDFMVIRNWELCSRKEAMNSAHNTLFEIPGIDANNIWAFCNNVRS